MKKVVIAGILIFTLAVVHGYSCQDTRHHAMAIEIIESISEEEPLAGEYDELVELYCQMASQPLNINAAGREELEKIFFLAPNHVEALLFQRYQAGFFVSVYDLQLVEGFDRQLIEWLRPLVSFGPAASTGNKPFKPYGIIISRARWVIETPRGYFPDDTGAIPFQGNKMHYYKRIEFKPRRNVDFGLVARKNPGEPTFGNSIPVFGHVAGYLSWKPGKFLQQVIVGRYRFGSGQGLAIQTGMRPRPGTMVTSIRNRLAAHRPSLSVSGAASLNGVLVSLAARNMIFTPFISVRQRSGRLIVNDTGERVATTLYQDGYYRTLQELHRRRNIRESVAGARVKYYTGSFIIEAGHLEYRLEHPLAPRVEPYNIFFFRGDAASNSWLALQGTFRDVNFFSELAFTPFSGPAIWAGSIFSPGGEVEMAISYRNIPRGYVAPLGNPFTALDNFQGERGIYAGLVLGLPGRFELKANLDYHQIGWLRHQVKAPSTGYAFLCILTYNPGGQLEWSLRYRYRQNAVNISTGTPLYPVGTSLVDQYRLQLRFRPGATWALTTRIDYSQVKEFPGGDNQHGFLMAQDMRYNHPGGNWAVIARYAMMDVDDYQARVYAHEPDVLYSMSFPAYHGRGSRLILMSRLTLTSRLDLWLRYARWYYTDRETTGSGNMTIYSNVKRECTVQLRARF